MYSDQPAIDLSYAYSILFDSRMGFSTECLNELEPAELKTAFRKKALATHPDRSMTLGRTEVELQIKFQEVSRAYEILRLFVSGDNKTVFVKKTNHSQKTNDNQSAKKSTRDHFFNGIFPDRELKIGQFLYYSKVISWKTLINAIVWQKKKRPLFGQIAKEWGYLTPEDIIGILNKKKYNDRFGEYALRNGYLTPFQQMAVIGKQRICQPLIGRHFIRKGYVTEWQMNMANEKVRLHNLRIKTLRAKFG